MWKTFLLFACVTGSIAIVSCDDAETNPTAETKPTEDTEAIQKTSPTGETELTAETKPTETEPIDDDTDGTRTDGSKRCGCYPPICGKNEVYYNCSGICTTRKCSEIGFPLNCDKKCTPGCVCKDNYVRADNGNCIPIPDCPSCGGDKNAQQGCSNYCGNTCSTYNKPPSGCPLFCVDNGCQCRKGFVYDNNVHACVKPKDCTPVCKANEEYSTCTNGGCDARNCSQIGKPVPCVKLDPNSCIKGCVCVKGYLRASNGTCVPKDQCTLPLQCPGQNEFYDTCISGCSNQTCETIGKIFHCPLLPAACRTGCRCKPGFYRNASNVCVSESQCPTPPCPEGEYYSRCPTVKCEGDYCPKNRDSPQSCPVGIVCDPPRCVCGLLDRRDRKTGKCIKAYDCPPFKCDGPNEEYQSCPATCPGENCTDYINKTKCPIYKIGIVVPCKPQCRCKKGYYRNSDGICILASQCAYKCGPNEVFSNCTNGGCEPRNCSQAGKPVPCVKLDPKSCIKGCVCQPGYLRSANGTCVPKNQCNKGCGGDPNAQPGCGYNCGKTCTTYKAKHPLCPRIPCKPNGCDCKDGYVFDGNVKKCVLPQDCITCGINEVYDVCPAPCPPRRCDVDDRLIKCAAPPKPGDPECKPGCRCADGYARNATGTCVLRKQCEQPLTCDGPNEIYDSCPAPCPGQSCNVDPALVLCAPSPQYGDPACKPACRCIDGYARNAANECVPRDQCHYKCGPNEVFSNCTNGGCEARNCSQAGKPVPCVKLDPKSCIKGCVCQPGYLRSANGTCVPQNQCNEGCGNDPNAHPGCGVNCGKTCSTYKTKNVACILICKVNGCDCNDGFVFDPNVKKCVVPKDCTPTCGLNEVYSSCTNGGCGHRNCSQLGQPELCIDRTPDSCTKGCICAAGYLRAANGTCVPQDKCPTTGCGGDPNAQPGCGLCKTTCATYKTKLPIICPTISCKPTACDCKDGFVFDDNVKKCVLPQDCTPICKVNEEYSSCINGGCDPRNCSQVGQPRICIDPITCIKGCVCIKGYLRASNGTCVPTNQCPAPDCPPGEVWNTCPTVKCDGDNCPKTRDSPQTCPVGIVCDQPRCVCEHNRKRDRKTGKCIPISDCPPFKCDLNEEYQACSPSCPGEKCSDIYKKMTCPQYVIGTIVTCRPACKCIKGYSRNDDGKCIPTCECKKR